MLKKHPLLIIFAAGIILLISGVGTSYFWLTRIYLPEQIDANDDAKKLHEWHDTDPFSPPVDQRVSRKQLDKFLMINESLFYFFSQRP